MQTFTRRAGALKQPGQVQEAGQLVKAELRLGLKDLAREHAANYLGALNLAGAQLFIARIEQFYRFGLVCLMEVKWRPRQDGFITLSTVTCPRNDRSSCCSGINFPVSGLNDVVIIHLRVLFHASGLVVDPPIVEIRVFRAFWHMEFHAGLGA